MLTIETLKDFGVNTEEGLGRCLGNEALYFRFIGMAVADDGFEHLAEATAAGDLVKAFEAAHALKGVLGNLAIVPLYRAVSEVTELLRSGTETDYSEKIAAILAMREDLRALCE